MVTRYLRHPVRAVAAGVGVLLAADLAVQVAVLTLRLAAFLVLPAAAALVAYRVGRRRGVLPARGRGRTLHGTVIQPGPDLAAEVAQLRAANRQLRADLHETQRQLFAAQGEAATLIGGLEAQRDGLRVQLADAQASAASAWDKASDRPLRPTPARNDQDLDRLLADRMSGVHPLIGDGR